jgi:hypothetical protein
MLAAEKNSTRVNTELDDTDNTSTVACYVAVGGVTNFIEKVCDERLLLWHQEPDWKHWQARGNLRKLFPARNARSALSSSYLRLHSIPLLQRHHTWLWPHALSLHQGTEVAALTSQLVSARVKEAQRSELRIIGGLRLGQLVLPTPEEGKIDANLTEVMREAKQRTME